MKQYGYNMVIICFFLARHEAPIIKSSGLSATHLSCRQNAENGDVCELQKIWNHELSC